VKTIKVYRWDILSDTIPGKRVKTRYHLSPEEALARDPNAKPLPGTEDERQVPETDEERQQALYRQTKGTP
jgi:hypothetical protein